MSASNFENLIGARLRGAVLFTHLNSASLKALVKNWVKILKYISNTLQVQISAVIDCPLVLRKHQASFQSHIGGWRGT